MMRRARDGGYAIGYFESWSTVGSRSTGVVEAAEEARAPIIIGFNGEFLSRPDRTGAERLSWYGALGRTAAPTQKFPAASSSTNARRTNGPEPR